ncbi:MAG TPA: hypothetical protein P5050_00355 [Bacteroidia bacterium]|nr:hypothetical protein [Bacteroidia bacterium]HRS57651.1 hypothetical protein [Bacteroidia bacterium]HRU67949.1 hypothetical protein [Bacteroidia bacterium]
MSRKIGLIIIILGFSYSLAFSQVRFPEFRTDDIELKFTKYLNGCMNDPEHTSDNELIYKLKGQIFNENEGYIPTASDGFNGKTTQSTPWETLSELVFAYMKKDVRKIKSLYNKSSQEKVSKVFEGENAQSAMQTLSECGKVKVLMGFEYQGGYMAVVETENLGINLNYFVIEKGKYRLSALADKSPVSWNIALYWKFRPQPFKTPTFLNIPDSISLTESKSFIFNLSASRNWLIVFRDIDGEPVFSYAQDGGMRDMDNSWQRVTLNISGKDFISKGKHTFYVIESNYPVQVVNPVMKTAAASFTIKVY